MERLKSPQPERSLLGKILDAVKYSPRKYVEWLKQQPGLTVVTTALVLTVGLSVLGHQQTAGNLILLGFGVLTVDVVAKGLIQPISKHLRGKK